MTISIKNEGRILDSLIKKLFVVNEWICAYRVLSDEDIFLLPEANKKYKYSMIQMKRGFWGADPFLVKRNSDVYVFFEYTDTKKCKSVIAQKKIRPNEDKNETIIYEFPYHTSYPCVFEINKEYYMVPETSQSETIELLKCVEWPNKWVKEKNLVTGIKAVDTTYYQDNTCSGFFIYEEDSEDLPIRRLYYARFDKEKLMMEEKQLLCVFHDAGGRPGGNILINKDETIRVVQPKTKYYGEKIEFYLINKEDTKGKYHEEKIGELLPEQIMIDKNLNIKGVHTFNRVDEIEIVDLLIEKIDLFRIPKGVFRRLNLFGYGKYESSGKMITDYQWR